MQEVSIPPCKVTRAHLGRVGDQSSTPTTYISPLISSSHRHTRPPEENPCSATRYQIAQDSRLFFLPSCLQAYPSSQHLGTTLFFWRSHLITQKDESGPTQQHITKTLTNKTYTRIQK